MSNIKFHATNWMKRFLWILMWSFSTLFIYAQPNKISLQNSLSFSPKYEVRAVWLTTIGGLDWPHTYARTTYTVERQKQELRTLLDQYQRAGINTVLLQTRVRGTVIYPSAYEPWDGCLSGIPGKSPGYDALAFIIDECHQRGMELHAWIVTIPVGKWRGLGCKSLQRKYPKMIKKDKDEGYMNPESSQTATYLANLCEEITRNYDIDGIHLDYIRYPETWRIQINRAIARQHITNIVQAIHDRVKRLKPWVKMSCSPIGKYNDLPRYWSHGWNAYSKVCQDAQAWLKEGLMDQLYPMMYFKGDQFYPFALNWKEESYGRMIVPGLGIYFMSPTERNWPLQVISQEMQVIRHYGMGHAYFRGKFLTDNVKGIYDFASNDFCRYPALIPAMTWQHVTPPLPPTQLKWDEKTSTLSWAGAKDRSNAPYLVYNIYASRQVPVDIHDARNLIATRVQSTALQLPKATALAYAVTAMDRYGNESEPIQSHKGNDANVRATTRLLYCDGKHVELPAKGKTLDATFVLIESLQGTMITTRVYQGKYADISTLPEGMYTLRSLDRYNHTHRLGIFMVKRNSLR